MKKLIVSYLLSVVACQVMAQDDDMYFASDGSQKAQKVGNSVSSSNSSGGYKTYRPYVDNNSYNPNDYCGSDRDVDEYNRRYRPEHDPYYNKDSVTISMNDYENYMRMKRWDGYRSTTVVVVNDPWYYDPWYYSSYYYDPWYYGWSWHWGYSYYPWYSGYYWRPYYYSSWSWGWGWYGRGWHGRYWGYTPVRYGHYRGGYATTTYSGRRSGWTSTNDASRRSYNRPSSYGSTGYGRRSGNINSGTGGLRSSGGTTYQRSSGSTSTSSMRRSGGYSGGSSVRSSGGGGFSGGGMRSSGVFSGGGGGMRSSGGGGFSGGGGRRR